MWPGILLLPHPPPVSLRSTFAVACGRPLPARTLAHVRACAVAVPIPAIDWLCIAFVLILYCVCIAFVPLGPLQDGGGNIVGEVHQRWHLWKRNYDLYIGEQPHIHEDKVAGCRHRVGGGKCRTPARIGVHVGAPLSPPLLPPAHPPACRQAAVCGGAGGPARVGFRAEGRGGRHAGADRPQLLRRVSRSESKMGVSGLPSHTIGSYEVGFKGWREALL